MYYVWLPTCHIYRTYQGSVMRQPCSGRGRAALQCTNAKAAAGAGATHAE
jgi:hypothetical protein